MKRVFVLGCPDPEMEEIERVLRQSGHAVRYAMTRYIRVRTGSDGQEGPPQTGYKRVRADNAYHADQTCEPLPAGYEVVFVECALLGLTPDIVVDHHKPGDPGFACPPQEYLKGSSLGQVLELLGQEPSEQQRLIAAADHCPTQAYAGMCPGVCPKALGAWRTYSRALRRGISPGQMDEAIAVSLEYLRNPTERVTFCNQDFPWVADRNAREFAEASARYNLPFMYSEAPRHGKVKLGIMGAAPEVIEAWMAQCGLADVYGNPGRGYAGGYLAA